MQRLALVMLPAAAAADVVDDPHSGVLLRQIMNLPADGNAVHAILASPVLARIESWGMALLALAVVSLLLQQRGPVGPDSLNR